MIFEIITYIAIGWFIASFPLFEAVVRIIIDWVGIKNKILTFLLLAPVNCVKCSTFWYALFASDFDLGIAAISSLIAYILENNNII